MTSKIETFEVFRYKVVYPGGTYLRISPATDAEKTGSVLEFGTVFDASKSLFLDGINYAKLSDGSGWVFEKKNDTQILELLQIIRIPVKKAIISGHLSDEKMHYDMNSTAAISAYDAASATQQIHGPLVGNRAGVTSLTSNDRKGDELNKDHYAPIQRQHTKVENRLWREVRARCGACATFDEFLALVTVMKISTDGLHTVHEKKLLNSINIIASITGQCSSPIIRDSGSWQTPDVATCLWVLLHMGSRVGHIMSLIVDSANAKFESASAVKKSNLLRIVLEVGNRTKTHASDLARQVDILPDDIRNFLQRWIIVQSSEEEKEPMESEVVHGDCNDGIKGGDEIIAESPTLFGEGERDIEIKGRQEHEVRSTPATAARHHDYSRGSWPSSMPNLVSSWLSGTGSCSSSSSSYLVDHEARHRVRASDLDIDRFSLDRARALTGSSEKYSGYSTSDSYPKARIDNDRTNENLSSILWRAVGRHIDKLADTDMQLAGLI